jgi:antitoxin component YwqK of YwqJK toxin-antitoxin module
MWNVVLGLSIISGILLSCNDTRIKESKTYWDKEGKNIKSISHHCDSSFSHAHGIQRSFYEDGTLQFSCYYNHGNLLWDSSYYENGRLKTYNLYDGNMNRIKTVPYSPEGKEIMGYNIIRGLLLHDEKEQMFRLMGKPTNSYEIGITAVEVFIYPDRVYDEKKNRIRNLAIYSNQYGDNIYKFTMYDDGETISRW